MTKYLLYTSENCPACLSMKQALNRLGMAFKEITLKNGTILPPDVRSIPTMAMEKNGKRTTLCIGWPGKIETLEKILKANGAAIAKNREQKIKEKNE